MASCPKCERHVPGRGGRCPECGTPLVLAGFRPRRREEGDPLVDPMLELFERDERVRYCHLCENEFRSDQRRCRRCEVPLATGLRSQYEAELVRLPVRELGDRVAQGPPRLPADLVRVRVSPDLEDARACLGELRFMGLEAVGGSDSLDPFDATDRVGIYVRAHDREPAEYLLSGFRARDPLEQPPAEDSGERERRLDELRGWFGLGKYRRVLELAASHPGDVEVQCLAVDALLMRGRVRSAEAHALEVAESFAGRPRAQARMLARAGMAGALGHDGTPFARGSRLGLARQRLDRATRVAPRLLMARKALVELLDVLGDRGDLRAELRRLERLNPNVVGRNGPFRSLRDSLGAA